ncbi:hypothetical protein K505DRAFT_86090 [Melanomma pulvis-pyrius CBS 109.77]|uniref:Uncharacterized protein n=1 Tax=Melanomma pulvis-pyrius CBS 109.77 TaxID=1314802 RepID=A0A6A6X0Z0_9PLEO|nr:hypothetical protein K505DRAFT_86090 [Melanomma pulvis-pyrius CBS 109.77]
MAEPHSPSSYLFTTAPRHRNLFPLYPALAYPDDLPGETSLTCDSSRPCIPLHPSPPQRAFPRAVRLLTRL